VKPTLVIRPAPKVFFDTNILLYAVTANDSRLVIAAELLAKGGCLSVQVLDEFASIARRKMHKSWDEIRTALADIRALCEAAFPLTVATHEQALHIAERYGYQVYDARIIASALEANCDILYSEDMHHGQTIDRLTIRNPFA
jgi:predicted nucleic acid-binding protein